MNQKKIVFEKRTTITFIFFVILICFSAIGTQAQADIAKLQGCWLGYWDIAFYGGDCRIGLEIEAGSREDLKIIFHRITGIETSWKAHNISLEDGNLRFHGPKELRFDLKVDFEKLEMRGFIKQEELKLSTYLRFDPEITAIKKNPDFFKKLQYQYKIPPKTGDGLICAHMQDVGFDPQKIEIMMDRILREDFVNIKSLLVIKDGKLVIEDYFWQQTDAGFPYVMQRDDLQNIYSATRTFTAALLGIAIDQGFIKSVDEKISSFFPEYMDILNFEHKKDITIEHLLTMESGFKWGEEEIQKQEYQRHYDVIRSSSGAPIIQFLFERPGIDPPGEKYLYNNELSTVLGEIVKRTTSIPLLELADIYLFRPLGITDYNWFVYPDEVTMAGNGLRMRSRDMAKLGILFLNGGVWGNKRIISQEWIDKSSKLYTELGNNPYGYHWWINTFNINGRRFISPNARGHYGQFIFIFPSLDMTVVVTSAANEGHPWDQPLLMLSKHLLPAVIPASPPSTNPISIKIRPELLDEYRGIYHHFDEKYGFITRRGKSLFFKAPGNRFVKLSASSDSSFFSRKNDMVLNFTKGTKGKISHYNIVLDGIEESGKRLQVLPDGGKIKKIIMMPRSALIAFGILYSAVMILSIFCFFYRRIWGKSATDDSIQKKNKVPRMTIIWAGISAGCGLWIIIELLGDAVILEELLNLRIYQAGWDEIAASWGFLILTAGLFLLTFLVWRKQKGSILGRVQISILAVLSISLILLIQSIGLLVLFP